LKIQPYGLKSGTGIVFNPASGDLLIIGSQSNQAWKNAVYHGAAHSFTSYPEATVPLYNSQILNKGEQRTLVINADNSSESNNDVVWTEAGVTRAFKKGKDSSDNDTSSQPNNLVVVVDSSSAPTVSKISPSHATKIFAVGYTGSKTSTPFFSSALAGQKEVGQKLVNNFQKLIQDNNVNVYMINKKGLKSEQLSSLIDATVAQGTSTKSTENVTAISSLSGYKSTLEAGSPKSFDEEIAALMKSNPESGSLVFNDRVMTSKEQEEAEKVSIRKYLERNWIPGVNFAEYLTSGKKYSETDAAKIAENAILTADGTSEYERMVREEVGAFIVDHANVQSIKNRLKKTPERLRRGQNNHLLH